MSTDHEMNSQVRVLQERTRRSSIALLLHERARGEDEPPFTPEYETEDPYAVDPTNLAEALGAEDMKLLGLKSISSTLSCGTKRGLRAGT